MSNIYIQEPPTNGKVLLVTSVGDIDIELWSKEAPKACRNFVQLCMEGYYDNTIFHRVIKGFIVQGGDPTGTGDRGDSVFGKPFKDEFHTRLRFNRRGLVAMANSGPNDNSSQFFFTFAAAPELNNKHTIFGKVAGDTIYNMIKLEDVETGPEDFPVSPVKIIRTEILSNPFSDIIVRESMKELFPNDAPSDGSKTKAYSKATKNFSLLSFGSDAEEEEEETLRVTKDMKGRSKSIHDAAKDPKLSSVSVLSSKKFIPIGDIPEPPDKQVEVKNDEQIPEKSKWETEEMEKDMDKLKSMKSTELRREAKRLKRELQLSRKNDASRVTKRTGNDAVEENDMLFDYRAQLLKYKKAKKSMKNKDRRADETMSLLRKFQDQLDSVKLLPVDPEAEASLKESLGLIDEEKKDDADDEDEPFSMSWFAQPLIFKEAEKRALDANVDQIDRYEIDDPRNPINKRKREKAPDSTKPPVKVKR